MWVRRAAVRRRSMFDDDSGLVDELAAVALEREAEVDFLGGVSIAVVVTASREERVSTNRYCTPEKVAARAAVASGVLTSERRLARHVLPKGTNDPERDCDWTLHRVERAADNAGGVRCLKDSVVIEKHEHVARGVPREQIPSSGDPEVLVRSQHASTRNCVQGRCRRHVEHDDLVETRCRSKRGAHLLGSVVTDDAQREREGHSEIIAQALMSAGAWTCRGA